ncbi:MAG TPA: hypothetical protein VFZ40_07550 [Pyrinomonadaceae bacterium]
MSKFVTCSVLLVLLLGTTAFSQNDSGIQCVVTLYRLRGERWKLIKSVKVNPKLGEEELTNERIRLPGSREYLFASVFPTDESMHSAKGADSMKIGLAISNTRKGNAFERVNNAVAEATLATLDTLRVERTAYVGGRQMLTRFECWDSALEKQ